MSPPTPKVTDEEEDVDDLDDLDDLLDDFAAARPSKPAPAPAHVPTTQPADTQASSSSFEDELSRNMAALFASLGSAPSPPSAPAAAAAKGDKRDPATDDGDDDRESQQLQHLFQQLLKSDPALAAEGFPAGLMDGGEGADGGDGESLEALLASLTGSLTNNQPTPPLQAQALAQQKTSKASSSSVSGTENNKTRTASSSNGESSSSTAGAGTGVKLSFEETIKQTMNNMKASEQESRSRSSKPDSNDPLAALLASLNIDASDLDLSSLNLPGLSSGAGLGGLGDGAGAGGGDFSGLLDGMMKQLMTREILEEPLVELSEKYPPYLVANKSTLPAAQYATYAEQSAIVTRIVEIFRKEGYSDDDPVMRSQVTGLMTQMQDLGSPPDEIMGEMPEGLDFGGEGCSIM